MASSRLGSWVSNADLVEFYSDHRNGPDDLYPSERHFLPELAEGAETVLDVGCGAGGFAEIWRAFNPATRYVGVDASPGLVEAAARLHPESTFEVADCIEGLPFPDRFADVVSALGWLHWEPRYPEAIAELWRATGRSLFCDVRMHDQDAGDLRAEQRLALSGPWDGKTTVPYISVSWPEFARTLVDLGPSRVRGHGYWGEPADTVVGVDWPVCFAAFVLERGAEPAAEPEVSLDLPLEWPL